MGTLIPARLLQASRQASLVHVHELPVVPSPTTPCAPVSQLCFGSGRLGHRLALQASGSSSGFTHYPQVRQSHQAESSLCRRALPHVFSTDHPFTSSCSPPALAGSQLLSVNGGKLRHEGTFTLLLTYAPKRTVPAPSRCVSFLFNKQQQAARRRPNSQARTPTLRPSARLVQLPAAPADVHGNRLCRPQIQQQSFTWAPIWCAWKMASW